MLKELNIKDLELHIFGYTELGIFPEIYNDIKIIKHRHKLKNPAYWYQLKKMFNTMECVFDITYGDGFSDIYGKKWNATTNIAKQIAVNASAPFVLLPQTYGPYESGVLKRWALRIIKGANFAFSRDLDSANEINAQIGNKVVAATDLAFALPYQKDMYQFSGTRLKIGFNASCLLWDDGHDIKLKTNYREYCRSILKKYSALDNVEVHLIPHVIYESDFESPENDSRVCKKLHKEFPTTVLAPDFKTPIEAKSYISNMDVFIGARMHSTIGAISSGVVTIPFSYSKKFEGLFGNLNYPYVISATKLSTQEALKQTDEFIENRQKLKKCQDVSMSGVEEKLDVVRDQLIRCLNPVERGIRIGIR